MFQTQAWDGEEYMLAFTVAESEVKILMNKLLREDMFDNLEVRSINLETIVNYEISGNINSDYLAEAEERAYAKWSEVKPYIFQLIKGHKKPKLMKIVFSLNQTALNNLHENAGSAFLNFLYEGDCITCITGTSQKSFSLDKSVDIAWEEMIKKFFSKNEINIVI